MGIFQQFTNDKRQLDAATERIPRTCDFLHTCVPSAMGALRDAVQSLADVPGRKAVVFVGTYRGPVESIANLANRAGVVIYALNTRGLGEASAFPAEAIEAKTAIDLAKHTGGRRVLTDPGFDLTSDLNEVMEDLRGYYLLGYHTALTDADFGRAMPARRKPEGHTIEVNGGLVDEFSHPLLAEHPKMSMQFRVDMPVARPGPYQVRAAVRDAASGRVGSSYAFLDIPDFNRRQITLSSVTLSLPAGAAVAPAARPEWNEFAPGTAVQFRCEVFGLKTPGKPPALRVDWGVRLYRGGEPVVDIPPSAASIENQGDLRFLAGAVQIPNDLPAGNYEMEITAYDRLEAPKKQAAMQWTDVTIVGPERPGSSEGW